MIKVAPYILTAEKPGAADWRRIQTDELAREAVDQYSDLDMYVSQVDITVRDQQVVADVITDDEDMKSELDGYFRLNNALRSRYASYIAVNTEHHARILYLTNHGLRLDEETLGSSGLPYEGLFDSSGENFVAVGRKSIGTFKSLVIGAMSGILTQRCDMLPVHSAIVQAPNGNSVAFSGRGNMGKTTSLLSTYQRLADSGFKVVTDDWAMIDEDSQKIMPVDYLVGIRPESLQGLRHVYSKNWVDDFTKRVITFEKDKSKGKPLGLSEVYGANMVGDGGVLKAVILTSLKQVYGTAGDGSHVPVDFNRIDDSRILGARMRDDAYHAPEIPSPNGDSKTLEQRYEMMASRLDGAVAFTRTADSNRRQQAGTMADWVIRQAA